jgi:hypothetical protein
MSYSRHTCRRYGCLAQGHWHAIGFGGHGVAPTTLAGELLASNMLGEQPIPDAFSTFGLSRTFGVAGTGRRAMTYWAMQAGDGCPIGGPGCAGDKLALPQDERSAFTISGMGH